ncbi:uncharacterized protein NECHADRAFT_47960 [Fusarium vanettenii 77-13-4]|uniref:Peptidase A1 domain-containing protein n=1 Tax=Fusarium vanettenii (strain ATCC MYA-4622 / CBS 123669 / FGSC 9596 / NRRL 45880 / 77-13-4) TaxID=660122 RepID=C7ZCV9_FUSV7|nr:uncharacterized protein NECHADRAFT_47960 [Fusarium vanettenii 77-13-4]EEU37987.1 hypothetical protein NECHADRAFT_47960 [Fusarium vanettenii 77-13-4]
MAPLLVTFLSACLAFGAVVSGCPFRASQDQQFSVEQIKNPGYVANCPKALARAYLKYGAALPEGLAEVMRNTKSHKAKRAGTGTGTVVTTPEDGDVEWLTPIQIGTPGQVLNLDLDTGSSDLWVFTNSTQGASQRTSYNPGKSSTSRKLNGYTFSIQYGDGSSSTGDVYLDKVSAGRLSVNNQAVETASRVDSSFNSEPNLDGLMGLGFSSLNTVRPKQQKTFFDNAIPQLRSPVFTANLKRQRPGTYNFGYIDNSTYTGNIGYVPVDSSRGWWQFTSNGYAVGNDKIGRTSINGIADTGTTLLLLPNTVNQAYYAKVSGSRFDSRMNAYTFRCSTSLPTFSFAVGGVTITIPGTYLNFGAATNDGQTCYGSLQPSDSIGINIFGDIALKAAFVVFDGGQKRIGWARKPL